MCENNQIFFFGDTFFFFWWYFFFLVILRVKEIKCYLWSCNHAFICQETETEFLTSLIRMGLGFVWQFLCCLWFSLPLADFSDPACLTLGDTIHQLWGKVFQNITLITQEWSGACDHCRFNPTWRQTAALQCGNVQGDESSPRCSRWVIS